MATEADTCRKFVVPKLQAAGWDSHIGCELAECFSFGGFNCLSLFPLVPVYVLGNAVANECL